MTSATQDRQNAQSLARIAHSLQQIANIMRAMQPGIEAIGRTFQSWTDVPQEDDLDPNPASEKSKKANELFDKAFADAPSDEVSDGSA